MAARDGVLRRCFWPTLDSTERAKTYLTIGACTLVLYGFVSIALLALMSTASTARTLGTAGLVLVWDIALAIFLYRGSRVAAVVTFAFYIVEIAAAGGTGHMGLLGVVVLVIFVNAVWAAFAYQRLLRAPVEAIQAEARD